MATFGNFETKIEPLARLMRDHVETHALVERAEEAAGEAIESPSDSAAGQRAMEALTELEAHLAHDLVVHIRKEEEILFPALMGFAADLDQVIDEMVEQHDEVRFRKANIERALRVINDSHDEVDKAHSTLLAALATARATAVTPPMLEELLDAVKRLRWILEGHFGDEEDDLFPPAVQILSTDTWAELAAKADALDLAI
jgi:iron-sulfur cluster repair protein YtfE (RIC family)